MNDEEVVKRILKKRSQHQPENYADGFNIVMLGTSGVGKTVFMTAMLRNMLLGYGGFRLEPYDPRDIGDNANPRKQRLLEDYGRLCNGEELPATARHSEWRFKVFYKKKYLFTFRWIDYRGGSVDPQNVNETNPMDLTHVVKSLRAEGTVAAFILADAERFEREADKVKAHLGFAREILVEAFKETPKRGLHLVLILTKVDAVAIKRGFFGRSWDFGRIRYLCQQVFDDSFLAYVRKHPGTDCLVVPVSAYGMSARKDRDGRSRIRPGRSSLESFQVHAPLIASFRSILDFIRVQIPIVQDDVRREREDARQSYYSLSWWRRLWGAGSDEANTMRTCEQLLNHLQTTESQIVAGLNRTENLRPEIYYPLR